MAGMLPMAVYGLEVPAGDVAIPARPDIPSAYRITMAAIDPSAEAEGEEGQPARATLKIIRQTLTEDYSDDEDEEDFDIEELERMLGEGGDSEEDSDDEEANGGPSDPAKTKAARKAAAQKAIAQLIAEQDDEDSEDGMDVDDIPNGVNGKKKSAKALGKRPAAEDEDSEDDEDLDSDEEGEEYEEFVICTLDPLKNYQQPLDITVGENERVLFKVSGTHTIYLTGNYVQPADEHHHGDEGMYDPDSDEEDDYDLEPDSDELDEYDEEDELDDLEDPRITEVDEDDEAPALVAAKPTKADKKGKNKRPAEDDVADSSTIDELIASATKKEGANGEKLSKKQQKKLKKNDGTAVPADEVAKKEAEAPGSTKSDKKVQFAKELEQGPTPTKDAKKDKAATGPRTVQGVKIDDRKVGSGPAAKSGDRVGMRYIGKLEKDGKVFDSNKKGKPFSFKLGSGEVIKGWDIGIAGMAAGGERRITIPANLAYGSRGAPPSIPGNATLIFDVKLLEINKK
ncbi:Putative FKBP-type peptidyl-prolyl cis-trans isomerase domain, Nucleoplasmin-like protein [Septoria linicola]|uniref:peptidylprolyl isomerase n=1 Tax=Septoria linicola TaxID=215465 RepID=A0A9Q9AZF8_9PEZI|nr:Putative FKBP-type peptidyl-prolyl cis-trans isomerase domain, Nucleoplasmin-like protein [Septoria linicola]